MSEFKDGALWMAERLRDHVKLEELKAACRELEAMEDVVPEEPETEFEDDESDEAYTDD